MDKEVEEWEQLECPKCRSSHFGSHEENGVLIRMCHDEFGRGCRATWPEYKDRVFVYTKRRK